MAAPDALRQGFVALTRFGYGSRGDGDIAAAGADPRGFVKAELNQPGVSLLDGAALKASPLLIQALFDDQERVKQERKTTKDNAAEPPLVTNSAPPDNAKPRDGVKPASAKPPSLEQQAFRADAYARLQRAISARCGISERLVAFWSNHFCVSARKSQFVRITAGAFEREAIRPHVLGRFADMLRAVEQHPTMLHYLDNQQSVGPTSKAGLNRKLGLNENLGREILELHTLGVGAGYTQGDVTALARIITGWTYVGREGRLGEPGRFIFNTNAHEPGEVTLLGKIYRDGGREQGEAALADLARHPATAHHIATKLAQHFVADIPPPALVQRLAKRFLESGGDLRAVTLGLIEADEAWAAPLDKMRNPYEFLIAAARLTGRMPENAEPTLNALTLLGMPLWQPPGPNGWPDTVSAWASAEGMKQRLDVAALIASRMRDIANPLDVLDRAIGPAASIETRQAVSRAESRQQGLALLLMSPEMQRR